MKLASVFAVFLLAFALAVPAHAVGAETVALEVDASDIYATVPLCTYWYTLNEDQGITPKMTVTNHSFSSLTVSGVKLPNSVAAIAGIPRELMQSASTDFTLNGNPNSLTIQKRTVKQAVIFTISKSGGQ